MNSVVSFISITLGYDNEIQLAYFRIIYWQNNIRDADDLLNNVPFELYKHIKESWRYNLEFVCYLYSRLCVTAVWGEIQLDNDDDDIRFVIHQHIFKPYTEN
jgi:hypothetical protein